MRWPLVGQGCLQSHSEMKAPWTDPGLRELLALAALAALRLRSCVGAVDRRDFCRCKRIDNCRGAATLTGEIVGLARSRAIALAGG
jgi:hypothetical protein